MIEIPMSMEDNSFQGNKVKTVVVFGDPYEAHIASGKLAVSLILLVTLFYRKEGRVC
jgi:hypothetical protein